MSQQSTRPEGGAPKRQPNSFRHIFTELLICIIVPTLILKKLSGDDQLGPALALVVALSLPLGYSLFQFYRERKFGFVPILGFISILLTGGIGLLELPAEYIAIKEAAIPLVIGLATLVSLKTPYPLVRTFLFNDMVLNVRRIETQLEERNTRPAFDHTLYISTLLLASSFFLSATLNFLLAKWIVVSPAGTAAFNDELGTMNLLSYPVIVLPCMLILVGTLIYLFKQIEKLTGLELEDIVNQ
ncbi:MAG: VC0807 family protein [Pseudomonadota bacterium]